MEVEKSENQIFFQNNQNPSDHIQNSFGEYFLAIQKEIPDYFKNFSIQKNETNIRRYLNANTENKSLLELLPINIINPELFIDQYCEYINFIHKKPNKIPHFTNFEQNEIQLLYLLHNTHLANEKIEKYSKYGDTYTNNHLVKINNIIKDNADLIGYVYILKWLQKVISLQYDDYNEDEKIYKIINSKEAFKGETSDPIVMEEKCQSGNDAEYNDLMQQFIYCLFKGNITKCQKMCEQRKIEEFGSIFSGGCPLFDRVIASDVDYTNFDKDLLSPSMINKEYDDFTELLDGNDINPDKNIFGNSLYILWLKVMYENADLTQNNTLLNNLFRFISGNYKDYELKIDNIYEYLYINVLNLLHSKLFYELTQNQNHKMVQYHYIESESFKEISQVINNGGRTIFNIIDSIIQNNNYEFLSKKHPFLWLELCFIKLFFIKIQIKENIKNNIENDELFNKYFDGLYAIINKMKKGNDSLNLEYDEIINNEREFNYSTLNNRKMQAREFYDMINVCLYRAFFSTLTTFYSIENNFIDFLVKNNDLNQSEQIIEEIYNLFDDVFCNYIKQIIKLDDNLDFDMITYIVAYMFNYKSIIFILTEVSHYINSNEKYQQFIISIKNCFEDILHSGESLSILIIRKITNNSNLLKITDNQKHNFTCIDDALNYYVQIKIDNILNDNNILEELSDNDKYKINQILCLFDQTENKKLNQDTSYSYLLKLFIKFLINYKYKEAYELKFQLNDYIYDQDAVNDELIIEKIAGIGKQIDKINDITDADDIQFYTILTSRYLFIIILDCFYYYANKIIIPYKEINKSNKKIKNAKKFKNLYNKEKEQLNQNVIEFITEKLFNLNKFIKIIITNEIFFNYNLNYYGEESKNEYRKLLGDWSFQSIKWICDIFNMGLIDRNNYDSLNYVLNEVILNKDDLNKFYLENEFNVNNIFTKDNILENKEKKLFEIMSKEQQQKVVELLYQMAKINKPYLDEVLDDELDKKLIQENKMVIQELDFDFEE